MLHAVRLSRALGVTNQAGVTTAFTNLGHHRPQSGKSRHLECVYEAQGGSLPGSQLSATLFAAWKHGCLSLIAN